MAQSGFKGETFIALETHGGWVYVGEAVGGPIGPGQARVFRVKP